LVHAPIASRLLASWSKFPAEIQKFRKGYSGFDHFVYSTSSVFTFLSLTLVALAQTIVLIIPERPAEMQPTNSKAHKDTEHHITIPRKGGKDVLLSEVGLLADQLRKLRTVPLDGVPGEGAGALLRVLEMPDKLWEDASGSVVLAD
jgi:hypothetical protein